MIHVIAKALSKLDRIEQTKAALVELTMLSRIERGAIKFELHQDINQAELFYIYETWEYSDNMQGHRQSKHVRRFLADSTQYLQTPLEISVLNRL